MRWRGVMLTMVVAACVPAPARADGSPAPAIVRDVPRALGTVVLVHGGGWSGPSVPRQWAIDAWPGAVFRAARWNTVTIDYAEGKAGLAGVAAELEAVLARSPRRPVCAYGESAGGHLALLAAARLPRLRCVAGLGVPTDLVRWREDAVRDGNAFSLSTYAQTAGTYFGMDDIEDEWQPVAQAAQIRARVLLVGQADDEVLPIAGQLSGFADVHPATDLHITDPGDEPYLHGSFSARSRGGFEARLRRLLWSVRRPRL